MSQDISVLALVKGTERYVFLYNEQNRAQTLRTLGRFASDPELSFTWYDAAVLSQKIRQETRQKALKSDSDRPAIGGSNRCNLPLTAENDFFSV